MNFLWSWHVYPGRLTDIWVTITKEIGNNYLLFMPSHMLLLCAAACVPACAACCMHVLLHVPLLLGRYMPVHSLLQGVYTHLQIVGTIIISIFNTPVMMGNTPISPITVPPYWWKMYSTQFYFYKSGK